MANWMTLSSLIFARDWGGKMIKKVTVLVIILALILTAVIPVFSPVIAQGQGQITVTNISASMDYPLSLNISAQIKSNVNITDIRVQYQVEQSSFAEVISEAPVSFSPSSTVNAQYTLNMLLVGQFPQGTGVDYWWIVKDAAGKKLQTGPNHYTVTDNQHQWQNLNQGKINLLWYGQNDSFGQEIMSAAQSALSTLSQDTGASPDKTINISIYTNDSDYHNSTFGEPEWSGGETLTSYNSIILIVRPDMLSDDLSGLAHELTHAIIDQVTSNPYNTIPFWLNEGLAMHNQYSRTGLISQFSFPLKQAVQNNTLISIRSLSSPFSAFPEKAYLSYAESYSVVTYMLNQYGANKMTQLLDSFKTGITYDGALHSVYGLDMDALFNQWKVWAVQQYAK
jgi:hypothetical protein